MHMSWDDVHMFLTLAETRSMSRAAAALKVQQPTISRRLAALEEALGYPLFLRSASGVSLTAAGERLLAPARKMAEWAGEISRVASQGEGRASGLVRIAAPPGVAFDFLTPFAAWLRAREPQITLQLLSDVRYVDLARGEADLALRMRPANQSDLTNVASITHRNAVFVAKDYARELPKKKLEFKDLRWITWAPPYEHLPPNPVLEAAIANFKPAFSTDNFLVMLRALEAGLGAMVLPVLRHRFSETRRVVPLKLSLGPYDTSELHLVCAKSALDIPRVRTVAYRLKDELERALPR
jgi:DNA-binding transcriptional LysR family regulator